MTLATVLQEIEKEGLRQFAAQLKRNQEARNAVYDGENYCEVCGQPGVREMKCKRICLKCGFMTGCSEGI